MGSKEQFERGQDFKRAMDPPEGGEFVISADGKIKGIEIKGNGGFDYEQAGIIFLKGDKTNDKGRIGGRAITGALPDYSKEHKIGKIVLN